VGAFWRAMIGLAPDAAPHPTSWPIAMTLTPEVVLALCVGAVLAYPVLPALLDHLRIARIGRRVDVADPEMDTLYIHPLPRALLLLGLVLSSAMLTGDSLNPFLYFRF